MYNSPTWFAIVGKNQELSKSELEAQLPYLSPSVQSPSSVSDSYLEIKGALPSKESLDRLGGIVRAGIILERCSYAELQAILISHILRHDLNRSDCLSKAKTTSHRLDFGLSAYSSSWNRRTLERLALSSKSIIKKSSGRAVRVVFPQEGIVLPTPVIAKQLLDKGGREFVILPQGKDYALAETKWVHPFEEWGEREFGKPDVDSRRGLLPQKLARMMINLSGLALDENVLVFDPFCGSGVILMEARELGCQFFGSDIDPRAILATKHNLGVPESSTQVKLADARAVSFPELGKNQRLLIVTEPYLGPLWHGEVAPEEKEQVVHELVQLYSQALQHWCGSIRKGTRIVMIFPVILGIPTFSRIVDRLPQFKYTLLSKPILYERDNAKVAREIVRLEAS